VPVTAGGGAVGEARAQDAPRATTAKVRSLENMIRTKTVALSCTSEAAVAGARAMDALLYCRISASRQKLDEWH
jgi:hypothetical protein